MFFLLPLFALLIKRQQQKPTKWLWRFGIVQPKELPQSPVDFWFHAASLGEINAAAPIIENLIAQKKNLVISTMTLTGFNRAKQLFPSAIAFLLPMDFYPFAKKFIKSIQPKNIIFFETEIWANFWWIAKSSKIPLFVLNARISPTSFKNYEKLKFFFTSILQCATKINCISKDDAQRYEQLGANPESLEVSGNIKLCAKRHCLFEEWAEDFVKNNPNLKNKQILLCASTHLGEDEILLQTFLELKTKHKNLALILVPRHPERFSQVENLIGALCKNTSCAWAKFSQIETMQQNWDILLGDTLGDMHKFYALADFIFVAGSLIKGVGGHNFLEAGVYLKPTISGKYVENFAEIAEQMQSYGALEIIEDAQELSELLQKLLQNPQLIANKQANLTKFFTAQTDVLKKQLHSLN